MKVAIAGAGISGLTLAALLRRTGHEVELAEKAEVFGETGAGVQIGPNGTRVLEAAGLAEALRRIGTMPQCLVNRRWQDGRALLVRPMGAAALQRYGHPFCGFYRPDLIDVLAAAAGDVRVRFGSPAVAAHNTKSGAVLELADGDAIEADVVVGADGIHSAVRDSLFGRTPSRFSEVVAYRALVPRERVPHLPDEAANWLGPGAHLLTYFVGERQRYLNVACFLRDASWDRQGWNELGSLARLREYFADWSPALNATLDCIEAPVYRWALHDRLPLPQWGTGRVTLVGDAAHAMVPFLGQGACQGLESAAVLCRLLSGVAAEDAPAALCRYARTRLPRVTAVQQRSWDNAAVFHLPDGPEQQRRDADLARIAANGALQASDWLFGYDAVGAGAVPSQPPNSEE